MLVLMVFILGLVIGLIIDTMRKKRYNRLSARVLQDIYESSDMEKDKEDFGPYLHRGFTPPKDSKFRMMGGSESFRDISTAEIIVEREDGKSEPEDNSGKWICPKCGSTEATLIHRKGCDKCTDNE